MSSERHHKDQTHLVVISKTEDCLESRRETQLSARREGCDSTLLWDFARDSVDHERELINVNGKVGASQNLPCLAWKCCS